MRAGISLLILTLSVATSVAIAAPRELTVFSDGILVEIEATARKGVVEVTLPAPIRENSLRVKPLDNGRVGRVELLPYRVPDRQQKDLDSLIEQKNRLEDRMKALDTREDIFAAAAKSQSSKAPRKTKTNPDPLTSVRQGTDFAIAQLEAVFTARRRTSQELKKVEANLAHLQKSVTNGPTVRITVSPPVSRVMLSVVMADGSWKPYYEIRLTGDGTAKLAMLPLVPALPVGYVAKVTPSSLTADKPHQLFPLPPGTLPRLAEWTVPVEKEYLAATPLPLFSFTIKNSTGAPLMAGEAVVYSKEEYLGAVLLPALAVDASVGIKSP